MHEHIHETFDSHVLPMCISHDIFCTIWNDTEGVCKANNYGIYESYVCDMKFKWYDKVCLCHIL